MDQLTIRPNPALPSALLTPAQELALLRQQVADVCAESAQLAVMVQEVWAQLHAAQRALRSPGRPAVVALPGGQAGPCLGTTRLSARQLEEPRRPTPLITILEDDPVLRQLLAEVLEEEGYAVMTGADVGTLHPAIVRSQPELLILDWHLRQRAEGQGVLARLRTDPATTAIPVLICTADRQVIDAPGAHGVPADAWVLGKPFALDELLGCVSALAGPPPG